MPFLPCLLALCAAGALALGAAATPLLVRDGLVTLPLAGRLNVTGSQNVLARDRARAKALRTRSADAQAEYRPGGGDFPLSDFVTAYTADVLIGTPPTSYTLLVDTGSANTWVGAGKPYVKTRSSVDTGETVFILYGSGALFGEEFMDTVKIGPLTIYNQSIGVAEETFGFPEGIDGILGIGPVDLTAGTVSGGGTVSTVLDNAVAQGLFRDEIVGISFEPSTCEGTSTDGELTFGGIDPRRFIGRLDFVPITSTSPASLYVGIDQSITYGFKGRTILSSASGIVDTGTTLILIPSDAFAEYQQATGGTVDSVTGLLKITKEQYACLESLFFHIGENTYEFTPNAQIWPRALNSGIGGDADSIYLVVADAGDASGSGFEFVNGFTFLQRFYHVFDVAGKRAGFASTKFTHAVTN
ncbi:transporter [Ganoderma sinense ZZ0214-1]|uniref:Transporter n=1 Tax=Ganoderma sinense ZZ0214-1 TaxID=1077348 RepID=A0A2G8S8W1_9APHY|nr:transporter [Ganoderma sinense ZZ0214-1]PIL30220.1 transporter [Ganoderma sinense ZZ0214-1]